MAAAAELCVFSPFGEMRAQSSPENVHSTHSRKARPSGSVVWVGSLFKPCQTRCHPGLGGLSMVAKRIQSHDMHQRVL